MDIDQLTKIVERSLAKAEHLDEHARSALIKTCIVKEASRCGHLITDDLIATLKSAVGRKMAHHRLLKQEQERREAMEEIHQQMVSDSIDQKLEEANEVNVPIS